MALAVSSRAVRTVLDHAPLGTLVGVQTFRLAGIAFLLIVYLGILPPSFARAGYGDLDTGALALGASLALARKSRFSHTLFWLFSAAGLYDLTNVAYLLLAHYPVYSDTVPSSAPAFQFSLVLIPALAAPMALLLHLFALRSYLRSEANHPRRPARCATGNLHRQSFAKRHAELYGAGVRGVDFFQSRTMYAVSASTRIEQATQEGSE